MLSRPFQKPKEPGKQHPRLCTNVGIIPEEAKTITQKYFESLGLDYQLSYGAIEMCDVSLVDSEEFGSNTVSVDYKISVYLKDKDGTEIICPFFVNSRSGKVRENLAYQPTKDELEALMKKAKEHC